MVFSPERRRNLTKRASGSLLRLAIYILLIDLSFVFIYPFLYMLATSLKSYDDLHNILVNWIPTGANWENYKLAAETLGMPDTLFRSVFVTVFATVGHLISCAFIGYGFARFDFPLKNGLFFGVILSAALPVQVMVIPLYMVYNQLGMVGTLWPLMIPTFFGFGLRGGIFIYLFRQFFYGFPATLEEAARIDGCGRIRSFFSIALPSAGPTIIVTTVLSMVWHWNDYYEPSIYTKGGGETSLLTQMLPTMYDVFNSMMGTMDETNRIELMQMFHDGVVMAATAIAIAPLLIAYGFLQRKFMESIELTGLVG